MNPNNKNSIEPWEQQRGVIRSRKGGWKIGEAVYCHGYDLIEDFIGKISYFQLLILNATGRMPEKRIADWFEAAFICVSWPDPRIWCNQVGALAGTMRTSPVAATSAGLLAADSRNYAQKTLFEGCKFIRLALDETQKGLPPEEFINQQISKSGLTPKFVGYSRPIAKGDERISAIHSVAKSLGFPIGKHLELAYKIEKILLAKFDESMNFTGYVAAFLTDQGYSAEDMYRICSILVSSGVTACYVDTFERPPGTFLPMRCEDIDYQGPPPREVPD